MPISAVSAAESPRAAVPPDTRHDKFERLVAKAQRCPPVVTAVVHPCDEVSLRGAVEAARLKLIVPLLVGPSARIREVASKSNLDIDGFEIADSAHSHDSAAKAVEQVRSGRAQVLMKGSLHTDELMGAVIAREAGLRTSRRISHCFIMDVPGHDNALVITDAAVNIAPSLADKVDIVQHAIDLAISLGCEKPKLAILCAVETVNSKMQATLDAAALCKMAERGQIKGGILDGPLAFDNAISKQAANTKGIKSEVAGDPDILLAPDLEAGNMLAKSLSYLAGADGAGIVLGARVPIILTSRADELLTRLASCAVAVLIVASRQASTAIR